MWPYQMRYVLKTLRVHFKVRKKFTLNDLDDLLEAGGSCILVYKTAARSSHAIFIDKKLPTGYRSWNRKKGTPPQFEREDLEKAIKYSTRKAGGLYAYIFKWVEAKQ